MNIFDDPSFEAGTNPYLTPIDQVELTTAFAHTGIQSLRFQPQFGANSGIIVRDLPVTAGRVYTITVWAMSPTSMVLTFVLYDGLIEVSRFNTTLSPVWRQITCAVFTPTAFVPGALFANFAFQNDVTHGNGFVYIDDVAVEFQTETEMLELIESGLLVKLQGINGVSPYLTVPGVITRRRVRVDQYEKYPAYILRPFAGDSEDTSTPYKTLQRHAWWEIFVFVKDEDEIPDQVFNGIRDITRAIEFDQTLGGLGFLGNSNGRAVVVEAWDPWEVSELVSRSYQAASLRVRTSYFAAQGDI